MRENTTPELTADRLRVEQVGGLLDDPAGNSNSLRLARAFREAAAAIENLPDEPSLLR